MGAVKVETAGTQNHSFSLEAFRERFRENFDYTF
jgi:adenosine kinase